MHYLATDTTAMCGARTVTAGTTTAHIDVFLEAIASNDPKVCQQCVKVMRRYSVHPAALDLAEAERLRRIRSMLV